MNCRPGDRAIVIGNSKYAGRIVAILYAAPKVDFCLPNQVPHEGCRTGRWVLKSCGSKFPDAHGSGMYGVGQDKLLIPLPRLTT